MGKSTINGNFKNTQLSIGIKLTNRMFLQRKRTCLIVCIYTVRTMGYTVDGYRPFFFACLTNANGDMVNQHCQHWDSNERQCGKESWLDGRVSIGVHFRRHINKK
jgi:hypothetical protein